MVDKDKVLVEVTEEERRDLLARREAEKKSAEVNQRAEAYLADLSSEDWFAINAGNTNGPLFCGTHRCPGCRRNERRIRVGNRTFAPETLEHVMDEWVRDGLIR